MNGAKSGKIEIQASLKKLNSSFVKMISATGKSYGFWKKRLVLSRDSFVWTTLSRCLFQYTVFPSQLLRILKTGTFFFQPSVLSADDPCTLPNSLMSTSFFYSTFQKHCSFPPIFPVLCIAFQHRNESLFVFRWALKSLSQLAYWTRRDL